MITIGLLGGVASGKSQVAELFRRQGAAVLDADRAGHEVLRLPEIIQTLVARWGPGVLQSDGQIDRRAVGRLVFAPTAEGREELLFLEGLAHPLIRERLSAQAADLKRQGARAAILDAPVMLKAGWDGLCDKIVYVDAPYETRLARAAGRGWNEEEFRRREAAQESLDEKRRRADWIVDNSGSVESTQDQVEHCWRSLFG